ncbi:hypothetical protein SHK09_09715 [Polaribacter sp. PL03]|uniref:helix-turn-helix transcriptional regulator n=1 Tax=Polaribacter sp. PL03 TaxID=3088353 RepID=UPI0029D2215B|nr:hypothetical protein [Polaribacter sp. PL03]MDX6747066.1 hypothetical protein [Polaribacter sp. PL03]
MKSKILYIFFSLSFLIVNTTLKGQEKDKNVFLTHIDSASNRVDNFPRIANKFLDSIPKPLENNIKGRIAEYYHLKAVISSHLNDQAKIYLYNILSLKYAEKEKKYEIAGAASIELFYNLYIIKKDTSALNYLKKAEEFYTLANDKLGLIDVMQMKAYIAQYNDEFKKSNNLILPKLNYYKSIKEDSFYYMYALFMLTSNYAYLNDNTNRIKYYKEFKQLEKDTTISTLLYKIHDVTIHIASTEMFLKKKKTDSTLHYLKKSDELIKYMNNSDKENHFKNYVAYYNELKNVEGKNNYIDSLKYLNESLIKKNIDASYSINESFIENSEILEVETNKKKFNRNWIAFLTTLLIVLIIFVIVRYKSIKKMLLEFTKRTNEYSFLQNNHEKLKVKVVGLENYIVDLKKEIKTISSITDIDDQRSKIKELHKEIHHSTAILLVKGEDHLDLINDLNVDFFNQISMKHPTLNSSETIICYYLFMGFKSKEIGAFINTSLRSVESKRYRITNKLKLKEKGIKLVDYLQDAFKQTLTTN